MSLFRFFLIGVITWVLWAASVAQAQARPLYLQGNVVCRERMALPPNAKVEVTLADVSLADAPAKIIARTRFVARPGSPISYRLKYDSRAIRANQRYVLQARITADNRLLYITTTSHPVFEGARNNTRIMVDRVAKAPDAARPGKSLAGKWRIVSIGGKTVAGIKPLDIEITPQGRVSGHSGCNGFGGTVRINGDKVSFSRMAATQMACSEVLMQQEYQLHDTFAKITGFAVSANGVAFFNRHNHEILSLIRR